MIILKLLCLALFLYIAAYTVGRDHEWNKRDTASATDRERIMASYKLPVYPQEKR